MIVISTIKVSEKETTYIPQLSNADVIRIRQSILLQKNVSNSKLGDIVSSFSTFNEIFPSLKLWMDSQSCSELKWSAQHVCLHFPFVPIPLDFECFIYHVRVLVFFCFVC